MLIRLWSLDYSGFGVLYSWLAFAIGTWGWLVVRVCGAAVSKFDSGCFCWGPAGSRASGSGAASSTSTTSSPRFVCVMCTRSKPLSKSFHLLYCFLNHYFRPFKRSVSLGVIYGRGSAAGPCLSLDWLSFPRSSVGWSACWSRVLQSGFGVAARDGGTSFKSGLSRQSLCCSRS